MRPQQILKQLYLGVRVLILDEPTSVLTPQESDEVLSHARKLADAGLLTVVPITHKFREVRAHAGAVTVLRGGRIAGGGAVAALDTDALIDLIGRFGIRCAGTGARIDTFSGGNVQRTVLARELSKDVRLLIAQNHCLGLDFAATREIRERILGPATGVPRYCY